MGREDSTDHDDPMLAFTRGDAGVARHLRDSLRLLRDRSGDEEFRRLADEVISGNRSIRDLGRHASFDRVVTPHVQRFGEWWESLSDEERERQAAIGRAVLDGREPSGGQ